MGGGVEEAFARAWEQLTGRVTGPMWFRFLLQPAMAIGLAVRAGCRDAAANRAAYLSTMIRTPSVRRALIRATWNDIGRLCLLALGLDVLYQLAVLHRLYPLQALIVMCLLAVVPYLLVRGPISRVARRVARLTRISALLVCAVLVTGVTAVSADVPKYGVKAKAHKHFDFSSLKTYCWNTTWPSYDKSLDRAIVLAVDRELTARGLTRQAAEPCDVIATYASVQRTDVDLDSKPIPGTKLRQQYDVGTLVVLLKRPQSGIELFRGRVDTPLEAGLSKREAQVNAAIAEMFEEYPMPVTRHRD
jgi:hypothetical protein